LWPQLYVVVRDLLESILGLEPPNGTRLNSEKLVRGRTQNKKKRRNKEKKVAWLVVVVSLEKTRALGLPGPKL